MKGRKIKCRTCGCTDMYETTEHYNPDIPLTGDQLRLQQPFRRYNWPVYEGALADKSTSRFRMYCTRCNGLISTTGELHFVAGLSDSVVSKDELIPGNAEDSAIDRPDEPIPEAPKLVLTPEPTYAEKMSKMKQHPSKPKKSRRK